MKISDNEVILNTSLQQTSKTIYISLSKKPEKFRSRKLISTNTDVNNNSNIFTNSSYTFEEDEEAQFKSTNTIESKATTEIYEYNSDNARYYGASVTATIENPNPALFIIEPSVITFNHHNYNLPVPVEIRLIDRRYSTEYYTDVRIFTESELDLFYDLNEFYFDISVLVAERRNSFFKTQEGAEKYTMPSNYYKDKKLKLNKLRISGCFFNFIFYAEDTVAFGSKAYKKQDILQLIAQLNGVDPALVQIPGEYPEFSPVAQFPIQPMSYKCVGIDGKILDSNGTTTFSSNRLADFPDKIKLVISDIYEKTIDLSAFNIISRPNVSQLSVGPLSNAIVEFDLGGEILDCEDFIRIDENGNSSLYYYGVALGGAQGTYIDKLDEVFDDGFTIAKPFQLQLFAEITKDNAVETQCDSITHFISLKKESSEFKPIHSDFSNELEVFAIGATSGGVSSILKLKRTNDLKKHDTIIKLNNSNEIVPEEEYDPVEEEPDPPTVETEEDKQARLLKNFHNSDLSLSNEEVEELDKSLLLPFRGENIIYMLQNYSEDIDANQFIIPRQDNEGEELEPLIFDLSLINKYGFVAGII